GRAQGERFALAIASAVGRLELETVGIGARRPPLDACRTAVFSQDRYYLGHSGRDLAGRRECNDEALREPRFERPADTEREARLRRMSHDANLRTPRADRIP